MDLNVCGYVFIRLMRRYDFDDATMWLTDIYVLYDDDMTWEYMVSRWCYVVLQAPMDGPM